MPPTIQSSGSREDRERRRGTGERRSELVCRVKYNNSLPDIPFDPKFITYPFESTRFVQYNPTSLERAYKHELLTEHDLGVTIDLINPDTYKIDLNSYLEPEDEKLLEDEVAVATDSKRSRHHNKNVSWLRKTEYISTEYNRFTQSAEKAESKLGYNLKKLFQEEDHYKDRESQIRAINETFDEATKEIMKHYTKPGVTPVDILPVYPDFEMWKHPCAQVIFDSDPAPVAQTGAAALEEMSQAMIRGMVDESGNQFVAYFLPTAETRGKRKRDGEIGVDYEPEDEYEYMLTREYNWNVKNKMSKGYEETYFFVMKPEGVYYNELETRVRLSKRRKIGAAGNVMPTSKSRLVVKHRELNDGETNAQEARLSMLEPPMEEEEEEEIGGDNNTTVGDADMTQFSGNEEDKAESGSEKAGSESGDDKTSHRSRSRSRSRSGSESGSERGSRAGSPAGSRAGSGSDSGSESEEDTKRKDEEEIFGSASSGSDSD